MNQSRTIRLPVHVVKELNQVLRTKRQLEAMRGNGDATVDDVARRMDRPVDEVRAIPPSTSTLASLDAPSTSTRLCRSANPSPTKTPRRRRCRSRISRSRPGPGMDQASSATSSGW